MSYLLAQDAPAMLLDTLVKLASLGASGVCVLAIFWVGWLISKLGPTASVQQHRTVRLFMGMTIVIAVIAFASGIANAWFNARVISEVKNESKLAVAEQVELKDRALKEKDATEAKLAETREQSQREIAALKEKDSRHSEIIASLSNVLKSRELTSGLGGVQGELKRQLDTLKLDIARLNGKTGPAEPKSELKADAERPPQK
jgi:hypothetical protein